jgi:hypothetical protein
MKEVKTLGSLAEDLMRGFDHRTSLWGRDAKGTPGASKSAHAALGIIGIRGDEAKVMREKKSQSGSSSS